MRLQPRQRRNPLRQHFLLKDTLRGAWKFNGYVVSDCDAIVDIYEGHHFTKSQAEAAAVAMKTWHGQRVRGLLHR